MTRGSAGLAIAIWSLSGSAALAQAKPAPAEPAADAAAGPPKPPPQLEQLKFFAGTWHCEGKGFASPFAAAEHPLKATVTVKWTLNDFWQTFAYEEKKTKEHPGAAKVAGTWGWDAGGKRFVRADADAFGGWFTATSTGWAGDQLVWVGDLSTRKGMLSARHAFTKKSDKEFEHAFEMTVAGKNTPVFAATCKK
jgi:hypothetical protein